MSGLWLQGLAIALPASVLICLLLERLDLGRVANLAGFGIIGLASLMALVHVIDKLPAATEHASGHHGGTHVDVRLYAGGAPPSFETPRRTEERILAAPSPPILATVSPPAADTAQPIAPSPPATATSNAAPQCSTAPSSEEIERRCADLTARQTAPIREELRVATERLRKEAEIARTENLVLAETVRRRDDDIARFQAEAEQHRNALMEARAALAKGQPPPTAPASSAAPVAAPAAPVVPPPGLNPLRQKLDQGFVTTAYVVKPLTAREIIRGTVGSHYAIQLQDAADGKPLLFEPGAYSLANRQAQLDVAAGRLRADVLSQLGKGVAHRLYVRAFATSAKFARPRNLPPADAKLGTVNVLPRLGAEGFAEAPVRKSIVATFGNDDLPVLRAASVSAALTKSLGETVTILDGGIRDKTDGQNARAFEVILFVSW